jgi:hypothetical protein
VNSPLIKEYYISFETEGKLIELKVPKLDDYKKINIGDKGKLTYQKNRLYNIMIYFEKE